MVENKSASPGSPDVSEPESNISARSATKHLQIDPQTIILSIAVLGTLVVAAFFTERFWGVEEWVDSNAIYQTLHTGHPSWPIYGYFLQPCFDRMYIHPPIHPLVVGSLMHSFGLSFFYAEPLPVIFLSCLSVFFLLTGRMSSTFKSAILMGWLCTECLWLTIHGADYCFHARPDAELAMAWLAGLLAFEMPASTIGIAQRPFLLAYC